jgi:hypothetical protein
LQSVSAITANLNKPRGRGFQPGHDERRRVPKAGDSDYTPLPILKRAVAEVMNDEFKTSNGKMPALKAMITGQVISAINGNTKAFETLLELGFKKELQAMLNVQTPSENIVVIGFKQPEDVIELEESPE